MPLILSEENTKNMTDEQLLLQCVEEYANPDNYEPYEKDYGVGRPVWRMPMIGSGKGCHARRTLEVYNQRKERMQELASRPAIAAGLKGVESMPAVATGNGHAMQHATPLTPGQQAYVRMHKALAGIKDSEAWDSLPPALQDDINQAHKAGAKWL